MQLTLPARLPFSLSAVIASHGWVELTPFSVDWDNVRLKYIACLNAGRVEELIIQEAGHNRIRVEVDGKLCAVEQIELKQKVEWMLGLDLDFSVFYALARHEPKLERVEQRAQGRLLRSPTVFEDAVKTILTTNTSWAGTMRMVEALVTQFGTPLSDGTGRCAFPTAEQLAVTDAKTLRSVARLGYRAPYVVDLAVAVTSGMLDLESLKTSDVPTGELREYLLTIKGIGSYAAANLLMILGRYDFLPVDSSAVKRVSFEWYGRAPVGQVEVEAAFEQWAEWKALAYWFWDWSYRRSA